MKRIKLLRLQKRGLTITLLWLVLSGLLAACSPSVDTSKLEVVTAAPLPSNETPVPEATATAEPTVTTPPTVAALPTTPLPASTLTPVIAPTATKIPPTATAVLPTATAVPVPAIKASVILEPMSWEAQTWNNCAPVSAMMVMSYYGIKKTQADCAKALRPGSPDPTVPGDKHVRPEELEAFLKQNGLKTMIVENGTLDKVRALLSAGVPVITQQWLHEGDDIGHYRVARGYDLKQDIIIYNDPYDKKPNTVINSAAQDKLWKGYDRRYFPVYTAKQEAAVKAILGEDATPDNNLKRALTAARVYSESSPKDIDGWRNLGYLTQKSGDCKGALNVWEQKLVPMLKTTEHGPYNRFLWYQAWPVECYNKVGNYKKVVEIAPNEIEKTKIYAEMRYEYAFALVNVGRKTDAIAQLKLALLDDINYQPTRDLLNKLGVAN